LHCGVVRGTTTCAVTPLSCAASATACPWLPELCVTTPCAVRAGCSGVGYGSICKCMLLPCERCLLACRTDSCLQCRRSTVPLAAHMQTPVTRTIMVSACHSQQQPDSGSDSQRQASAERTCCLSASDRLSTALRAPRNLNAPLCINSRERQGPSGDVDAQQAGCRTQGEQPFFPLLARCCVLGMCEVSQTRRRLSEKAQGCCPSMLRCVPLLEDLAFEDQLTAC